MTRFLVIDSTGLGRAMLDAAHEREDALPLREPGELAARYDAVVADTCLTDEIWSGGEELESGTHVAEVHAPDFRKLARRLAQ